MNCLINKAIPPTITSLTINKTIILVSENALYKMVYRAYITELKQFVRTIEKGGESK